MPPPRRTRILWTAFATALAVALLLLLWKLPQYQIDHTPGIAGDKRFDAENEARKTLAQLLGGTVVLLGLYFSAKTYGLSRQGHLTARYTKAIEQLGKTDNGTPTSRSASAPSTPSNASPTSARTPPKTIHRHPTTAPSSLASTSRPFSPFSADATSATVASLSTKASI